jgi:hypothetical protein
MAQTGAQRVAAYRARQREAGRKLSYVSAEASRCGNEAEALMVPHTAARSLIEIRRNQWQAEALEREPVNSEEATRFATTR